MTKVGDEIRRLRESRLMSLHEAANRSGVHVSTLSKIESGDTEKVRFSTIRKISKAFDMDPIELAKKVGMIESGKTPKESGGTYGKAKE